MKRKNISLILFGFGLLVILIVHLMDYRQSRFLLYSFRGVEERQQTLINLQKLTSYLKDIQRSHRGYVITHQKEFLIPYENAVEHIPALLNDLSRRFQHDEKQKALFDTLRQKVNQKIDYAESAIVQVNTGKNQEAVEGIPTGKRIFDGIVLLIAQLEAHELYKSNMLAKQAERHAAVNFNIIIAGTAISMLLLLIAMIIIYRKHRDIERLSINLQEANHEMSAFNEELQSMNDQLEAKSRKLEETQELLEQREKQLLQAQKISRTGSVNWVISTDEITFTPEFARLWEVQESHVRSFNALLASVYRDDVDHFKKKTDEAVKARRPFQAEFRLERHGNIKHVFALGEPYFHNGELEGYLATFTDFTTQKQAQDELRISEEKFRSLLEAAPDPIIISSADGIIKIANKAAENIFGYDRTSLVGQNIAILIPYRFQNKFLEHRTTSIHNPTFANGNIGLSLNARRKDGSEISVEVNKSPLQTAEGTLMIAAIRDVTLQRLAEAKIIEANDKLEKANEALKKANDELSAFSYSISHDLKAPLRAINGYSSLLKEDLTGIMSEGANHALKVIQRNANRMDALINDLLELARLGTRAVQKEKVNMQSLINVILHDHKQATNAEIKLPEMEDSFADPSLIRQVWENLISNALKFTATRQKPVIEFGYERQPSEQIFWIRDNGVGFDMAYGEKLFKVFSRLHAKHEFEGTGAGLAICRKIVEAHGGRIWADAKPGEGAVFYFSLPVAN